MRSKLAILVLALPLAAAAAAPRVGDRLPDVSARDVTGRDTRLDSLLADPTLVVAITDRGGADEMRAWFERARKNAPDADQVSIVSLKLPFFVSDGRARSDARKQVPREDWSHSLLDKNGKLAEQLKLPGGTQPFVMVVDGQGKVLASFQGDVNAPDAAIIWNALSGSP